MATAGWQTTPADTRACGCAARLAAVNVPAGGMMVGWNQQRLQAQPGLEQATPPGAMPAWREFASRLVR
eukprot:133380-Chlamydomonas_euryale.AAC.1